MARTTPELMKGIIETDDSFYPDLSPFIDTASELVEEVCTPAGYSDTRLELIERWLSAHFYAIADMRRADERTRGVGESFQYKLGLNLSVTMYGQQAMSLDTHGKLAVMSKAQEDGKIRGKPMIGYLGRSPHELRRENDCEHY